MPIVLIYILLTLTYAAEVESGLEVIDNYIAKHSLDEIRKNAERGDTAAESALGYLYLTGGDLPQDDSKAAIYLGRASSGGDVYATFQLANMYLYGRGVAKSVAQGKRLLRSAADGGDAEAQLQLARLILENKTGNDDQLYLTQLAERGNADVMVLWADSLMGQGASSQDEASGFKLYEKAAKLGNPRAQLMVARCLWHGIGVTSDRSLAVEHYRSAINSGSLEAKDELSGLEGAQ